VQNGKQKIFLVDNNNQQLISIMGASATYIRCLANFPNFEKYKYFKMCIFVILKRQKMKTLVCSNLITEMWHILTLSDI
jgi:hypothetical protein